MPVVKIETRFEPSNLKVNTKTEATMYLAVSTEDSHKSYWCECDINVKPPLSLAHDKDLDLGRTRVGILKGKQKIEKQIKIYTRPNSYADTYPISITAYLYDEDGAIAERVVQEEGIRCEL
ncbi:MAG: hypothetical protein ABSE71_02360 [Candidatus Micrarchaeaceae archaeon]|jgi:hypothetical protein|nr:hypothetical protein [Candidatus Micrarchaeota archaeon]HII10120.1 hypothetical protein [Candidatus Micrarchaeota archaeon]